MIKRIGNFIDKIRYINSLIIQTQKMCEQISENQCCVNNKIVRLEQKVDLLQKEVANYKEYFQYVNLEYTKVLQNESPKILLVGFYGAKNLGDELMLQKIYSDLENSDNIYVMMCHNAEVDVFSYRGMNILHYPITKFDYSFLANTFECLIFGGGAIIDDTKYFEQKSYRYDLGKIFVELSTLFIEKGKDVYAIGVSTNKNIENEVYLEKLSKIVKKATCFSVRDEYSKKILEKKMSCNVKLINDIVMSYEMPEKVEKEEYLSIGIIWICYEEMMERCKEFIIGVQRLFSEQKIQINLIPFYDYRNNDYVFFEKIKEELEECDNIQIMEMASTFGEIFSQLGKQDYIVSMRYHGALIGLLTGTTTYGILYDEHPHYYNKMMDLFGKFKLNSYLLKSGKDVLGMLECGNKEKFNPIDIDNSAYYEIIERINETFKSE